MAGRRRRSRKSRGRKLFLAVLALCLAAVYPLQEQLADLTEANNTAYNAAADSVNLEDVRNKAMNEMGMVYESQGTVIEYESPASGYVKQYDSIPEDGVLAQSKDISN